MIDSKDTITINIITTGNEIILIIFQILKNLILKVEIFNVQKTAPGDNFARGREGKAGLELAPMTSTGSFLGISFKGKNGTQIISKLTHPKGAPRLIKDKRSRENYTHEIRKNDPKLNPPESDKRDTSKSSTTVKFTADTSNVLTPEEGGTRGPEAQNF